MANISFNVPLGRAFSDIAGRSFSSRMIRGQDSPARQVALGEKVKMHQRPNPGRSITGF